MYFRIVLSEAGSGSYGPQRLPYTPKWVSPREGRGGVFGSILAPLTPSVTASLRDVEINRFFGGILKIEDEMRNVW